MFPEHDVCIMNTLPVGLELKNTCVITPKGLYQFNEHGEKKLMLDEIELKQVAPALGFQSSLDTAAALASANCISIRDQLNTDQFIQLSKLMTDKKGVSLRGTTYFDKNTQKDKSLPNEMLANVTARIAEVRQVMIGMPEFQKFLIEYGDTAINMIQEEFGVYKDKYMKKSPEKQVIFKEVVDSIQLNNIKKEYQLIFKGANPTITTFFETTDKIAAESLDASDTVKSRPTPSIFS
jgi:hypothetical protein